MAGTKVEEVVIIKQAERMGEMEIWIRNEISSAALDFIT
jgi:hypothetical protein